MRDETDIMELKDGFALSFLCLVSTIALSWQHAFNAFRDSAYSRNGRSMEAAGFKVTMLSARYHKADRMEIFQTSGWSPDSPRSEVKRRPLVCGEQFACAMDNARNE